MSIKQIGETPFSEGENRNKLPIKTEITYTRFIQGKTVPIALDTLTQSEKETLTLAKEFILKHEAPEGSYKIKEGVIINDSTNKEYHFSPQDEMGKAFAILTSKNDVVGIQIVKKLDQTIPNLIKELVATESSFLNSFQLLEKAFKSDHNQFVKVLKKNGVAESEIELLFEPMVAAGSKVRSFLEGLEKIKDTIENATKSEDFQKALKQYEELIETQYESYAQALHRMMVIQPYYTNFLAQGKKESLKKGLTAYFREKNIQNPFGGPNLSFETTLISPIQRLPRHKLLFDEMNKYASQFGFEFSRTTLISSQNALINESMPVFLRLNISENEFAPQLENLKENGFSEKDIKEYTALSNAYNESMTKLEAIFFLHRQFPTNPKLQEDLIKLYEAKTKELSRLNQRFVEWGGWRKFDQLKALVKAPFIATLERQITVQYEMNSAIAHLRQDEVNRALLHSPLATKCKDEWQRALKKHGWSTRDIKRFNTLYFDHKKGYLELQAALEKAGGDRNSPEFKKAAQSILPKLKAIQEKFKRFGGHEKSAKLLDALNEMRTPENMQDRALSYAVNHSDFHSEMLKQISYATAIQNALEL